MSTTSFRPKEIPFILWSILLIFSTYLFFSNSGLYPTVFADEYTYSKLSRLLPLSESSIPGYLYLWIYSFTNLCGDGFLGCTKLLNAIFFVAAAIPIFFIARKIASEKISIFLATISIVGPISSYTAYFMPESLYFLGFWLLMWSLVSSSEKTGHAHWLVAGSVYGCTSLIKPHAIFFAPALFAYITYSSLFIRRDRVLYWAKTELSFFASAIAVKLLIGLILAGTAGLTLFGPMYSSVADSTASDSSRYVPLLSLAAKNVFGHLMAMTLLYGLPLVAASILIFRKPKRCETGPVLSNIAALTLLIIFNLIIITALFTASVASSGPYETPFRLHMRYYNFALPFLFLLPAGVMCISEKINIKPSSYAFILVLTALAGYAAYTNIAPFTPSFVDSPELRGIHINRTLFLFFSAVALSAILLAIRDISWGAAIYCYAAIPILVAVSSFYIEKEQQHRLNPSIYDIAGMFTKHHLSKDQIGRVLIVGSDPAGLFRTLFHLDHPKAFLEIVPRKTKISIPSLQNPKDWMLIIGDYTLPDDLSYKVSMNGFTLARIATTSTVDFRSSVSPEIIKKTRGLSQPESWGTWLNPGITRLEFTDPLPQKFNFSMRFRSINFNRSKELQLHFDDKIYPLNLLGNSDEAVVLQIDNPRNSRLFEIKIVPSSLPQPSSEAKIKNVSKIGLVEVTVRPINLTNSIQIQENNQ